MAIPATGFRDLEQAGGGEKEVNRSNLQPTPTPCEIYAVPAEAADDPDAVRFPF